MTGGCFSMSIRQTVPVEQAFVAGGGMTNDE
jgi:hypothetical protein